MRVLSGTIRHSRLMAMVSAFVVAFVLPSLRFFSILVSFHLLSWLKLRDTAEHEPAHIEQEKHRDKQAQELGHRAVAENVTGNEKAISSKGVEKHAEARGQGVQRVHSHMEGYPATFDVKLAPGRSTVLPKSGTPRSMVSAYSRDLLSALFSKRSKVNKRNSVLFVETFRKGSEIPTARNTILLTSPKVE